MGWGRVGKNEADWGEMGRGGVGRGGAGRAEMGRDGAAVCHVASRYSRRLCKPPLRGLLLRGIRRALLEEQPPQRERLGSREHGTWPSLLLSQSSTKWAGIRRRLGCVSCRGE